MYGAESYPHLRVRRSRASVDAEPLEVFDGVEDLRGGEGRRVRWKRESVRPFVIGEVGAHAPSLLLRASVLLSATPRPVSFVSNRVVGRGMLTKQSV